MRKIFPLIVVAVVLGFGWYSLQENEPPEPRNPRESAALQSVGNIVAAQQHYRAQYGKYADRLYKLGPQRDGSAPSEEGASLLPYDLAGGTRLGYTYHLRGYGSSFTLNAEPQGAASQNASFFVDQTKVVRESLGAPATASSAKVK